MFWSFVIDEFYEDLLDFFSDFFLRNWEGGGYVCEFLQEACFVMLTFADVVSLLVDHFKAYDLTALMALCQWMSRFLGHQ